MGFPVLLSVLKEERDDVEMVRGALETLVSALTPINHVKGPKNEVQPALMNTDLLSREAESISLLLSLLVCFWQSEEDFYVRYYTLRLLTALLTNSPNRLQEAILTIPRGITRLMDMLMDREDCLKLLNNLLCNNASNQVLLRETLGFDSILSILKLRGSTYKFTQQKTINLLSALETISLLIVEGPEIETGKDANKLTNKTVLVQKKVLDDLLMLGVESQWASVAVRCAENIKELQKSYSDSPIGSSNDLFSIVRGEERTGRVRMLGLGLTPSDVWGPSPSKVELINNAKKSDERHVLHA
ncbi:golgin candidate 6-like isoform X4 [Cornus florida]|uniref:golgin candidate 6-like isoform X4 n=1 Tax=Cornus florida TaxID=4283 RepID=UPI002897B1D9|nr:golgin candidate 6-like isoform X4 [Cornus florida]